MGLRALGRSVVVPDDAAAGSVVVTVTEEHESERVGSSHLKNFSILLTSQATTFVLSVLATVVIPRYLGAAVIGRLQLAISMWALGGAVIGFGMDLAISKAVARDPKSLGRWISTSMVTQLCLSIPVAIVVFGYAFAVGYRTQVIVLLVILGFGALVESWVSLTFAVLAGLERFGTTSLATVISRIIAVAGAIGLLLLGYDVYAVALIGVGGSIVASVIQWRAVYHAWREVDGVRPGAIRRDDVVALLRECAPYFWIMFFMIAYRQVDVVVISLVVENDDVLGWYSVYDRLAGTLMFIPSVFMTVIYPMLSRLHDDKGSDGQPNAQQVTIARKAFRLMLLISMPASFGLAVLARPIIELLYGEDFVNAAEVVVVGAAVISATYLANVFSILLISMDRQKPITMLLAFNALITIPLDIVLVPYFQQRMENGAVGGAVAYAITELIMLAGLIYLLPRGSLGASSLSFVLRVVAATAVMVAVVSQFRDDMLLVPIIIGVVVYLVGVAVFRLVDRDDRAVLTSAIPERFRPEGWRAV